MTKKLTMKQAAIRLEAQTELIQQLIALGYQDGFIAWGLDLTEAQVHSIREKPNKFMKEKTIEVKGDVRECGCPNYGLAEMCKCGRYFGAHGSRHPHENWGNELGRKECYKFEPKKPWKSKLT